MLPAFDMHFLCFAVYSCLDSSFFEIFGSLFGSYDIESQFVESFYQRKGFCFVFIGYSDQYCSMICQGNS